MLYDSYFRKPEDAALFLEKIRKYADQTGPVRLMEICGTHTMAIARSGLKSILPENIRLLSGPGCPVCVTPSSMIDLVLDLSQKPGTLIASYGDLLRVPGSTQRDSLLARRALGGKIESVYSPIDAVEIAGKHPETEVIFLGVGFETTAPGTAACILEAASRGLKNFSVLCLLKRTEPAVIGADGFAFLPEDYGLPGVVSGFEPADLLCSVLELTEMIARKQPALKNEYTRVVRPQGNPAALALTEKVFCPAPSDWRGLGHIEGSGYAIKPEYAQWDAVKKFSLSPEKEKNIPGCRCADVIRGVLRPAECPLFRKVCSPENPAGPCMVSGEGACAAAYQYE